MRQVSAVENHSVREIGNNCVVANFKSDCWSNSKLTLCSKTRSELVNAATLAILRLSGPPFVFGLGGQLGDGDIGSSLM